MDPPPHLRPAKIIFLDVYSSIGDFIPGKMVLPGFEEYVGHESDVVMTPRYVAKRIVDFFKPEGRMLDPCCGGGVFLDYMPGAAWCEINKGRDFFDWHEHIDWIISNPPYSIFGDFLRHSLGVADEIVYFIPINKAFNSSNILRDIYAWGGIRTILHMGDGRNLGLPFGYAAGAVQFSRRYKGGVEVVA